MSLGKSTWEESIPSIHDGVLVDCRIHQPSPKHGNDANTVAVFAHPYAPLGGCMDDPVVEAVASQLLGQGVLVGLFNFRGAGGSSGHTSWTGEPELADFESVVGLLVHYLLLVGSPGPQAIKVIIGGYSFGSMLASRLPDAMKIMDKYLGADAGACRTKIRSQAESLAESFLETRTERHPLPQQPYSLKTFVLLISPLLPPVTIFVAPLTLRSFYTPSLVEQRVVTDNPTLALFGDKDNFTGCTKLQNWGKRLQNVKSSKFRFDVIHNADHFWRSNAAVTTLQARVGKWVQDVVHERLHSSGK